MNQPTLLCAVVLIWLVTLWCAVRGARREQMRWGYAIAVAAVAVIALAGLVSFADNFSAVAGGMTSFRTRATLATLGCLTAVGVFLSWVDVREHRLPNRLVALVSVAITLVLGVVTWWSATQPLPVGEPPAWRQGLNVFAAAVVAVVIAIVVSLVAPKLFGMGDAKLVYAVAVCLAAQGLVAALVGVYLALMCAGVVSVITLVKRRLGRARESRRTHVSGAGPTLGQSSIAFGPYLLVAPWFALWCGPSLAGLLGAG